VSGGPPRDPWADPATQTEQGTPYAGPPVTGPPGPWAPAVPPGWAYGGPPPYGVPGYGYPPAWGPPVPQGPRRPGPVIAAAVLAFVQAALVLIGSMYTFFFASVAGWLAAEGASTPSLTADLATEGRVLALVQVLSVALLVIGGILALTRRTRRAWWTLLAALGVQVLIAGYWLLRLSGAVGDGLGTGEAAPVVPFVLLFAAGPLVGIGLLLAGPGRRWFDPSPAPPAGA
jgi:hypothetical protein